MRWHAAAAIAADTYDEALAAAKVIEVVYELGRVSSGGVGKTITYEPPRLCSETPRQWRMQ